MTRLQEELSHRAQRGHYPVTVAELTRRVLALGYRLDRSMDTLGDARWMTGDRAGKSYPVNTLYPIESDTGLSFSDVSARRDGNFKALQKLRFGGELFAVSRGRIVEL